MKEILKKLRKYEIQIRKAVNSQMQGDFHSVFKGTGLEFDGVRPYQYGDDIRSIDWNVSAKGHGTYVKTFREEKEQTIFFVLDVSASQNIGMTGRTKGDIAKEICGVLALSGAKESAHLGLIAYSDQREIFLKPKKGNAQVHIMISSLFKLRPHSLKTNLASAISFALQAIKRRSVVIMISDFIDADYYKQLKALARKHDLVLIRITDKREDSLPQLGIIPVRDNESGKMRWINTSFGNFRDSIFGQHKMRVKELEDFSRKMQINFLSISAEEDYVPKLLKLFKVRNKVMKSA